MSRASSRLWTLVYAWRTSSIRVEILLQGVEDRSLCCLSTVARHVQRNPTACHNRYTNSLLPTLRRGKWSAEEDAKLKFAVQACGKNWTAISERVEGRTDAQCRERWSNILDPKVLGTKNWTEEVSRAFARLLLRYSYLRMRTERLQVALSRY